MSETYCWKAVKGRVEQAIKKLDIVLWSTLQLWNTMLIQWHSAKKIRTAGMQVYPSEFGVAKIRKFLLVVFILFTLTQFIDVPCLNSRIMFRSHCQISFWIFDFVLKFSQLIEFLSSHKFYQGIAVSVQEDLWSIILYALCRKTLTTLIGLHWCLVYRVWRI
jgi:hypothetical protein